jgi:hypothetical protein
MPTMTQSPSVYGSVLYDSYVNDPAQQPVGLAELASPIMREESQEKRKELRSFHLGR